MGLYVSHITTLPADQKRALYVYLLDYGWPDGEYEQIFKTHFQSLARRASETGAIVMASHRGVHFANEVLSYHRVFDFDPSEILPAILISKTHPSYFVETFGPDEHPIPNPEIDELCKNDVVLVPLRSSCANVNDFSSIAESIFSDLSKGAKLRNFRVAKHDVRFERVHGTNVLSRVAGHIGKALVLEPNFFGVGVDIKKLLP